MALWGVTDADEAKPKWAVQGGAVDPSNIFATAEGWVLRHYKKGDQSEYWDEVLVAVSETKDLMRASSASFRRLASCSSATKRSPFSLLKRRETPSNRFSMDFPNIVIILEQHLTLFI